MDRNKIKQSLLNSADDCRINPIIHVVGSSKNSSNHAFAHQIIYSQEMYDHGDATYGTENGSFFFFKYSITNVRVQKHDHNSKHPRSQQKNCMAEDVKPDLRKKTGFEVT